MGKRLSYRELGALTDRAAKGLQALGVGPGVKVGLLLPNAPTVPLFYFGVLKAGGTLKPLELLQLAGIDLSSPAPIRAAVAYVGSLVDELERAFAT